MENELSRESRHSLPVNHYPSWFQTWSYHFTNIAKRQGLGLGVSHGHKSKSVPGKVRYVP